MSINRDDKSLIHAYIGIFAFCWATTDDVRPLCKMHMRHTLPGGANGEWSTRAGGGGSKLTLLSSAERQSELSIVAFFGVLPLFLEERSV